MPNGVVNDPDLMEAFRDELIKVMGRINQRNGDILQQRNRLSNSWRDEHFARFYQEINNLDKQREMCQIWVDYMVKTMNEEIAALRKIEKVSQGR